MSADVLRRAAALMRERAEAAVLSPWRAVEGASGNWWVEHPNTADIALDLHGENARHIASWHPAVALAVAKVMDDVALAWEICDGWTRDLDDDEIRFEDTVDGGWLTVARAYLGESA